MDSVHYSTSLSTRFAAQGISPRWWELGKKWWVEKRRGTGSKGGGEKGEKARMGVKSEGRFRNKIFTLQPVTTKPEQKKKWTAERGRRGG
jgi:hypothetical protein